MDSPFQTQPEQRHTPSRVVLARMRRGLRPWQVADALGMSSRRMYDIEHGRCCASTTEIEHIATLLRFPERFFYRPHVDIPTTASFDF